MKDIDLIEHPKGSGIKIRKKDNKAGTKVFGVSYQIDIPKRVNGTKRVQKQVPTLKEAKRLADFNYNNFLMSGRSLQDITEKERVQLPLALRKLREVGISLTEAVDYATSRLNPSGENTTLSEAVEKFMAFKKAELEGEAIGKFAYDDYRKRSSFLLKRFGDIRCIDLDKPKLKAFFSKLKSYKNKKNYFNTLNALIEYAINRKLLKFNVLKELSNFDKREMLGRKPQDSDNIKVLTLEEVERLLEVTCDNMDKGVLPHLIARLFCGIRSVEASKLHWKDIKLNRKNPFISVPTSFAKGRFVRTVPIPPNAVEWFKLCDKSKPMAFDNYNQYDKRISSLFKKAKIGEWKLINGQKEWRSKYNPNAIRHSFGSYHLQFSKNSIETARLIGHSPNSKDHILYAHYISNMEDGDGEKYFNIYPKKKKESRKVIPFSEVA